MGDLYVGLAILFLASVAAFTGAVRFPRVSSKRRGLALMLAAGVATALYGWLLRDSVLLARCLPFSNLVVVGNWYPIAASVLAGLAWRHTPGGRLRRGWPVVGLAAVGVFAAIHPLLGRTPACGDRWDQQGICRQTTPYTCTPACAATVLKMYDIPATEQELA